MSDPIGPGDNIHTSPESATGPDSAAGPAPQDSSAPIPSPAALPQEIKAGALHVMSRHDDAGDYVAERRDQDLEVAGDARPETAPRRTTRNERYKRALERLRQENAQLRGGGGGSSGGERAAAGPADAAAQAAEAPVAGDWPQGPDEFLETPEARDDIIRRDAEFNLRARDYMSRNPQAREAMQAALSLFPPTEHIAETILRSEIGPELAYELTKFPDAIPTLNQLPPAESARLLGVVEGRLRAQADYAGQERERHFAARRRATGAPPPLRTLKGGAAPAADIHALARADDATDYWKARRAQERA